MAILYKHFAGLRTALCAVLAGFLLYATPAAAQADMYTVEAVTVDVTAENALAARDQAFAQAQQEAFKTLAARMLSESGAQALSPPDPLTISSLIQDYEITQEKLSAVRYVGTYTFRFRQSAVAQYFSGAGVRYTDVASKTMLVLPFYQAGNRVVLWSPYNAWMSAWNRAGNLGGLVPLAVPLGDLEDVKDIGDENALTYDNAGLRNILERYGAGEAVIAIAIPDANLALVDSDQDPATGSMTVNLYRTDRAGPEHVQQITVTSPGGQSRAQMMDDAVRRVYAALQSDWKQKTMVEAATPGNTLQVRVPFGSLDEWSETQRALERVYGITDINVRSISPKSAMVDIHFQGDEKRLRLALQQADMTLTSSRARAASYDGVSGMPLTYDLYLNRYAPYTGRF